MEIDIIRGDITKIEADGIINAANTSLLGGGGVDGAIHRAGGKTILEECRQIRNRQGGCDVGKAVITNAGLLPARKVIHTVGPKWNGGSSEEFAKLKSCYESCLTLGEEFGLNTLAFPNISTGIYGFPKKEASEIAMAVVSSWQSSIIHKVIFVCFDEENFVLYKKLAGE